MENEEAGGVGDGLASELGVQTRHFEERGSERGSGSSGSLARLLSGFRCALFSFFLFLELSLRCYENKRKADMAYRSRAHRHPSHPRTPAYLLKGGLHEALYAGVPAQKAIRCVLQVLRVDKLEGPKYAERRAELRRKAREAASSESKRSAADSGVSEAAHLRPPRALARLSVHSQRSCIHSAHSQPHAPALALICPTAQQ